jgi:hypothetical protein
MSALADAMEAIADIVGTVLDDWARYVGYAETVTMPGFIVGVPVLVDLSGVPTGRARYHIPITGAVELDDGMRLAHFLSRDTVVDVIQATRHVAWWGDLGIVEVSPVRTAPNGQATCLAADIVVLVIA